MILDGARQAFGADPSRIALVDDSGSWSWTDFIAEVGQTAARLGPGPSGEPVEIRLPSGQPFLTRFLAAAELGRPACTLHNDWAGPELDAATAAARSFKPGANPAEDPDPVFYIGFNMDDPVVGRAGGDRARKLRQAMSLVIDINRYLDLFLTGAPFALFNRFRRVNAA